MRSLSRVHSHESALNILNQLKQDPDFIDVTFVTSDDQKVNNIESRNIVKEQKLERESFNQKENVRDNNCDIFCKEVDKIKRCLFFHGYNEVELTDSGKFIVAKETKHVIELKHQGIVQEDKIEENNNIKAKHMNVPKISDVPLKVDESELTTGLSCEWCNLQTSSKVSMKEHIRFIHNRKFMCRKCNLILKNFRTFVTHKYFKHPGDCDKCDFSTKNRTWLNKHIHEEHNVKKLATESCSRCYKKLESTDSQKVHLQGCVLKQCNQCKEKRYVSEMEAHIYTMHKKKSISDTFTVLNTALMGF